LKQNLFTAVRKFLRRAVKAGGRRIPGKRGPINKIAIKLVGGLGDNLIGLAWVQELYRNLAVPLRIDIYGRPHIRGFAEQPYVTAFFPEEIFSAVSGYDLKLTIFHFIEVDQFHAEKAPDLAPVVSLFQRFNKRHDTFYSNKSGGKSHHPYAEYCALKGWNRWDKLGAARAFPFGRSTKFGIPIRLEALPVLSELSLDTAEYITMNTGVDSLYQTSAHPKSWPAAQWEEFCALWKKRFPQVKIVQVGGGNSNIISGADLHLIDRITLEEAAVVLKQGLCHVDGEGGLVHLNHCLGKKSVVIFGPTPADHFGYPENINLSAGFCSPCMWTVPTWTSHCPRGFEPPECMRRVTPEQVLAAAQGLIASRARHRYALADVDLYSSAKRKACEPVLDRLLQVCKLPKKNISHHILAGECRVYVHASKQWEYPYAIRQIEGITKRGLKIADVGGGRGALSWFLAETGHDVTVYDIDFQWDAGGDPLIEQKFLRFAGERGFTATFGSVFNVPAEDETFDAVTCISVLEHVPHKYYALKELFRILRPGGRLILTYDLVLSDHRNRESLRREIFTPQGIEDCLREFGVSCGAIYSHEEIKDSINCVRADGLKVAARDLTFGAMTLEKRLD
jgi:ADP-heptose:LPS heptosyltransferase/SAM-dependent methyltransferase